MSARWEVTPLLEGTTYSSSCTLLSGAAGRVVVDTGLVLQESQLLRALHGHGLTPGDIDVVINTHLHFDHCGNNTLFPRAVVFMSRAEWQWTDAFYTALFAARRPEEVAGEYYPELASHDLAPKTIRNVTRLARLFWRRERLYVEGRLRWAEEGGLPEGLEFIESPGHTPHHLSLRVDAAPVTLIAGDAVLTEDPSVKVRTMIPYSRSGFAATRQRLLDLGLRTVPGHGRAFHPHVNAGPRT